jgi:cell division transport system permease protein
MALTAIGTVAVSIVLLGVFLFIRNSFDVVLKNVVSQVSIAVYLKDGMPNASVHKLAASLRHDPRIDAVRFISKKQAMADLRRKLRGQMNLNVINTNPLPDTLIVHTAQANQVGPVAADIRRRPGVAGVNYARQVTERLLKIETIVSLIALGVVTLLFVATALIIYNTIRLTVYARQREIHIMQLVGATRWTVRWPFVFEGLLSGALGAAAGIGALWLGYRALAPRLTLNLPFVPLKLASINLTHMALELLAAGVLIGMLASLLSVSRSLQTA